MRRGLINCGHSTYLERRPLIPRPFPTGRSLTASGTLVSHALVSDSAGAVFALATSTPWESGGKAQEAITGIQYFLADGSTRKVVGGKASALGPADLDPGDTSDRPVTASLVVAEDGVFAREIRFR
jgi:hypothetical protein